MKARYLCIFLPLLMLVGCRATKYVPDNAYLLNKVTIKTNNLKNISQDELNGYLRQTPNTSVLGLWKLQLGVYNLSGPDTAKWINRALRKIGEAPEVYDSTLTAVSCTQLTRFMGNKGYFNASVSSSIETKKRKAKLTYYIEPNTPYRLKSYRVDMDDLYLKKIAKDTARSKIKANMLFDSDVLDTERSRIAQRMRYTGYYYFQKDYLNYVADSSFNSHQVELELQLRDYVRNAPDSLYQMIFTKYKISQVIIHTDYDPTTDTSIVTVDTVRIGNYLISYGGKRNLRPNTLINNCHIIPGEFYNERAVERTYSSLNALGPVKYVNISFQQVGTDELNCYIVLAKSKLKSFAIEAEGTYSAGDLGVAGNVGYVHRNLFHGAEELSIQGRGAYEWRQESGVAIEWSADASLKFPNFLMPFVSRDFRRKVRASTLFNVSYNFQKRPDEYTRTIARAGIQYSWAAARSPWRHTFDLFDLSYVYLPWISDEFSNYFLNNQSILKYSYEDHFIMRLGYTGSYSNYNANQPLRNYRTIQYGIETAGNLLYGINKLFKSELADDGSYKIFNIRYSQYVKTDVAITYHQIFDASNRFVYHAAFGIAIPYGNASSIPFEKRYYAGGANSVRGWSVRSLGPGSYKGTGERIDFNNQSGDIKLDLNLEYRTKLFWLLEGSLFLDAGNIWTIRDYETQPGGVFKFNTFYKQIALGYGAGLRFDFTFFVFRVDFGVKLFDPALTRQEQWRTKPTWKDDMAFHFAIGYPF